ncbi:MULTISPECIES: NAD(P)H-binding protein [Pontibacillus]|uniref:NAD(P)H-binding protein n=1 Tax=Pontibacillus chungwhensis TaxID=265426 RepID=A0ABY8UVZ5_9BACI|nr:MULTISPECIES: NAD(P)H-binding protein [Pontibacillus]MCD5325082.1 NAD(P)H-binding protein [Pontibacillus sp. HN14]WIF97333.1 NAD(P)H-binding protein [Pontibacillus chungwhensis]
MNETKRRPVVALTGASGYIGQNLLKKLTKYADVIALSRNGDNKQDTEHITWRSCDLYSMTDADKGLEGADFAVYLVHSMLPSAKLSQGSFEDMDVILADNFAQAAKRQGVRQIVYLSGIIPESEQLSRHLRSRLEVEEILRAYGVPVTTIRAGLIVGPKGSSFPILKKLVKRLPVMALPKWTRTKTHPIALKEVLHALNKSIGNNHLSNKAIDVGGPEIMSYQDMMVQTAESLGKKPRLFPVPFMTVKLSRLWVSLTTGTPKEMVYPLVESLVHPMTAKEENMDSEVSYGKVTFKEAVQTAIEDEKEEEQQAAKQQPNSQGLKVPDIQHDVRSVQRIPLPAGKSADWAASYYVKWLSDTLNPLVHTETDQQDNTQICLKLIRTPLLELSYSQERSTSDRALFYITGGSFQNSKRNVRGRLEFRKIPDKQECIVAIHDYMPSLPWFIYKYTQAKAHLVVMYLFRKHIEKIIEQARVPAHSN